jgi:hypothetical protein
MAGGLLKFYDTTSGNWVPILAGPTGPTGAESTVPGPTGPAGAPEFSHTLMLGGM